jgi:hypothetical protein
LSLLCKWWWYLENGSGLWQDIVRLKYVKDSPTCLIPNRYNGSPIWSDLLKIRHIYLMGRKFKIGNGKMVSFWLDNWLDGTPLCQVYPMLYELSLNQKCSVQEVKENGWVIRFKQNLHGVLRAQWYGLAERLNKVILSADDNKVCWKWTPSKNFSVKSVYERLT